MRLNNQLVLVVVVAICNLWSKMPENTIPNRENSDSLNIVCMCFETASATMKGRIQHGPLALLAVQKY